MIENRELFLKNIKYMLDDNDCGNVSDGDHSFSELYHHRAILTASLFNAHKEKCWKSKFHDTGDMFDGYFIVVLKQKTAKQHIIILLNIGDCSMLKNLKKPQSGTDILQKMPLKE